MRTADAQMLLDNALESGDECLDGWIEPLDDDDAATLLGDYLSGKQLDAVMHAVLDTIRGAKSKNLTIGEMVQQIIDNETQREVIEAAERLEEQNAYYAALKFYEDGIAERNAAIADARAA